jgi:hypothetical protein
VRKKLLDSAECQLERANANLCAPDYGLLLVIRELLGKESIPEETYYDRAGRTYGEYLVKRTIFSIHDSKSVTYDSTLLRRFCEHRWGGKQGEKEVKE